MSHKAQRLIPISLLSLFVAASLVKVLIFPVSAQTLTETTIAYTSFEEPELGNKYYDSGNPLSDHALQNNSGQSPVNYSSTGGELSFTAVYVNTQNGDGLSEGDDVGVTDNANKTYPHGSQGYQLSDPDGKMIVTLETVDLTSFISPTLSVNYYVKQTSWETDDALRIWLVVDGGTEIDLLNSSGQDIDQMDIEGEWKALQADLDGYSSATLKFELESDSGVEDLHVDNVQFQGYITNAPLISISQSVSAEPLLGGNINYSIGLHNQGTRPVDDRGYNLTVTDTLPAGLEFISASPTPTFVSTEEDGSTLIFWDNIADLEANESLSLQIVAALDGELTVADTFTNTVQTAVNTIPDNSGEWIATSSNLGTRPQSIDVEMWPNQSTGDEQAMGAGEYDASADWPYSYHLSVQNNNVDDTDLVTVTAVLPPGVAYMGNPSLSNDPNGSDANPDLTLLSDGSLELSWGLGLLSTDQYTTPVGISFDAAIPYKYRTSADTDAESGAFAGPMSGDIIPEDARMRVEYEAIGMYDESATSDGSQSTPGDDSPAMVTAEYATVSKSANPSTVGIGDYISYQLKVTISEYYTVTNATLVDVLPDGVTYVPNSANTIPISIEEDNPSAGQTTLTWAISNTDTIPGSQETISFQATVDDTYEARPYDGEPVVSGDSLTNQVTLNSEWTDVITPLRSGTGIPDTSTATVHTPMPTFSKEVRDPGGSSWVDYALAFSGDTMTFRLTYNADEDVDAKEIIIRDYLPRGMTYVADSDDYTVSGTFADSGTCSSNPQSPTIGVLNGLQYLEWHLCSTEQGSSWQVTIDAIISHPPDAQPGWLVANFGKLSGQNTVGSNYSLRDLANVDYVAPELMLEKSASSSSGLQFNDEIAYTITISNSGEATAYNVIVTDVIPADLILLNSGGSGNPTTASYSSVSGNPAAGTGGTIQWTTIPSLDVGATQTFVYTATVGSGLVAGQQLDNIATVAFNSRSDDNGYQVDATANPDDNNTDDESVYIRGLTVEKTANLAEATIGDTVHWTITTTIPAGTAAFWPVMEENNLPGGFDYVSGSSVLTGATFDPAHGDTPLDSGDKDLRWFMEPITNSTGSEITFALEFDTLVTGVKGTNSNVAYYTNNKYRYNADNDAFIGWYDDISGYNSTGSAYDSGYSTGNIDRRSPQADGDVKIIQPYLTLAKSVNESNIVAGGTAVFTLQIKNSGRSPAYEVDITDLLPDDLTFQGTNSFSISPSAGEMMTDTNNVGATSLTYAIDTIPVGATWTIVYATDVDAGLSADRTLQNVANVGYSSQPGDVGDGNGDSLPDERYYNGPNDTVYLYSPDSAIRKWMSVDNEEFTYGSTAVYTFTVPVHPINASLNNVTVTDIVDSRAQVTNVTNGIYNGNTITGTFANIPPWGSEIIVVELLIPTDSSGVAGDLITNQASYTHDYGSGSSNTVADTLVAPALTVVKDAAQFIIQTGSTVDYSIEISNVGNGVARNLVVSDTLPANISFVSGSAQLNGSPLADPIGDQWILAGELLGGESHTLTFQALVNTVVDDAAYINTASVTGDDSLGNPIPVDNSSRVPADDDPTDSSQVIVYGPLDCTTESSHIAYEDLKNKGWSDWDYNDYVVHIDAQLCVTANNDVAVAILDYEAVARAADFTHALMQGVPFNGNGRYALTIQNVLNQSNHFDTVLDFTIFGNTEETLGGKYINTLPEQTSYTQGYTATLTVLLSDPTANGIDILPPAPWDPYLDVWNTKEEIHSLIPGHLDNSQYVNDLYEMNNPMMGFDLPLVQIFIDEWAWPYEGVGIWHGYPDYVNNMESGGTSNADWADPANADFDYLWLASSLNSMIAFYDVRTPAMEAALTQMAESSASSRYFASPQAADLDGDGTMEIIIGDLMANTLEVYDRIGNLRWSKNLWGGVKAAVAIADLDPTTAGLEIVVGSGNGRLNALHQDGTAVSGWPVTLDSTFDRVLAAPVIVDLDDDGSLDVIMPLSNGRLYVLNADGTAKWNASLGEVSDDFDNQLINSSPTVADLDGDGSLEIIVGSYDHNLYAFTSSGDLFWQSSTGDAILSSPAVANIRPDVDGLEVVVGSGDGFVYLLDEAGDLIWKRQTGWTVRSSPLLVDMDGNGDLEIIIGSDDDKVWAWHHDGTQVAGWPQTTGGDVFSSPTFGDIDGDGDDEIMVGSDDGFVYAWEVDGTAVADWPQPMNNPIKGAPLLVNIDSDTAVEVIVADFGGEIKIFGGFSQVFLPLVTR